MHEREVIVSYDDKPYRLLLRQWKPKDTVALMDTWVPVLNRGPKTWRDREWSWECLAEKVAYNKGLEALVLADEIEDDSRKEIAGILITTGPHQPPGVGLNHEIISGPLMWLEYIAIAPFHRRDCQRADVKLVRLKLIGSELMRVAIGRSIALGCNGTIGLHADGVEAQNVYVEWGLKQFPDTIHPDDGEPYPVFFGDNVWADGFQKKLANGGG